MKSNGNLIWGIIFIAVAITILTLTSCGIKIPIHSCETPISKNLTCEELLICHNQRDTQNNRQMFRNFDKDWGWLLEEKCSKQKESHSYEGEFPRKTNTRDYSMIWFSKNTCQKWRQEGYFMQGCSIGEEDNTITLKIVLA